MTVGLLSLAQPSIPGINPPPSGGTPTGKNLIGLEGAANYSLYHIFANWWKSATDSVVTVNYANKISSIAASQPTSTVTVTIGSPCVMTGTFATTLSPDNSSFVLT